jgi:hypothetical protein
MNMPGGMGQQSSGMAGGLCGPVSAFEQAGLGHLAQSWLAMDRISRSRCSNYRAYLENSRFRGWHTGRHGPE